MDYEGSYLIEWQNDIELEVITDFDEDTDNMSKEMEVFRKGERVYVDIVKDHDNGEVDMQFGSGGVAYNVSVVSFRRFRQKGQYES